MWERCPQSQGFGIFGPKHAGGGIPLGGGGGSANREPGSYRHTAWCLGSALHCSYFLGLPYETLSKNGLIQVRNYNGDYTYGFQLFIGVIQRNYSLRTYKESVFRKGLRALGLRVKRI